MSEIRLGIVGETLHNAPRRAIELASQLGVQAVQFAAAGALDPQAIGETGRREFRTILKSNQLDLAALSCPMTRGLDAIEHQQARIEYVGRALELAAELGARKLIVPFPKLMPTTDPPGPRARVLHETLEAIGTAGDRIGTLIALEIGIDAASDVLKYLASFDTGSLCVNFDPANFLVNGHDPIANLFPLAGKLILAQARDVRTATLSGGPKEVPVGAGSVDWMSLIATLAAIEYRGFLVVNRHEGADRAAEVAAGVRFLRRFVPMPDA